MKRLKTLAPQMAVYLAGGVLSAVIDIGLLQLLVTRGVDAFFATSCGFIAGLLVNYAFHAKVTFKNAVSKAAFLRYLCVVGANYLMTLGLVAASMHLFGGPLPGKFVALPLTAMSGFFLGRHWIYKDSMPSQAR